MARTRLFTWLARAAGSARTGREPTRRDLLVGGLSAAAVGPAVGCGRRDRIAIVGGGLAGVHVAYRLAQAGVEATLYEASARLGGRTFTARGQFPDDQIAELGGEFIDSDHATLHALAEELGLALDDRLGGPYASLDPEVVWSSGAPVDPSALLAQFRAVLPALLDDLDAAESDEVAFAALDEESLADWLARRVPPAVYPELHTVLSVAYRGEFGREPSEQSALNLIYLVGLDDDAFQVFGESDERFHVHLGSDALVAQMAAGLPAGAVAYGHRLVRATGDGPFELTFAVADGERTARVDRVVFALPFTMLRRVDLDGLALSPLKREIVASLGIGMNTKVMAGFERPVWREDHGASGALTSDLPLQQTWDSSLGQAGRSAILTNFLGGDQAVAAGDGTPQAWVARQVLRDLEAVFPGVTEAYRGQAARMHWPTAPNVLGSYTCYEPGQWAIWSLEGEREGDLHFCGEHTSADWQGWMEGAAESGARVALEILDDLGIDVPDAFAPIAGLQRTLRALPAGRETPLRRLRERRSLIRRWGRAGRRA